MGESVKTEVHAFNTLRDASLALAGRIVEMSRITIADKGRFTMALSGGKTPELLYSLLASEFSERMGWNSVHLFWGDERYVPKDHPDSNFRMAYNALISKVPIPPQNVHRMPTGEENPEKAAEAYEKILAEFFNPSEEKSFPTFDVILLGIGEDGHTVSLFAKSPALEEKYRWVVAVEAPPLGMPKKRMTLTLPVINNSQNVFFLAFGDEKSRVTRTILKEPDKARKIFPAARVEAREGLIWYIDRKF
jgi:6-phosphogluconolactonase